jgi:S-formylglutathione hydrolase FrmB
MLARQVSRLFCCSILVLTFCGLGFSQAASNRLHFKVTVQKSASETPVSGRLIVLMTKQKPQGDVIEPGFGKDTNSVWIAAREVEHAQPGEALELDPDESAFPAPFSQAPAGEYWVMALLDTDHNAAYSELTPGDLRGTPKQLKLEPSSAGTVELALTKKEPEQQLKLPPNTEEIDFVSKSLGRFMGRPIHMKGLVVLPPSYAEGDKHYPTVYVTHGYGARMDFLANVQAVEYSRMMKNRKNEMIYVLLLQQAPGGSHEFADSVNNGPWGHALVKELIPYLESKYRMDAKPQGRFLTGHSSGGWATVWLQVAYPRTFGGAWATSPDPVDFRNFTGPNVLNAESNFYRKPDGTPWMLVRMGGTDVESLKDYAQQEAVLGDYGGQMASFEWVFSPRGPDGRPMQLFDRVSGKIDPTVARHWEQYDISHIVREHWKTLAPRLNGKLRIIVGTQDTFHLDESVRLLEAVMKDLGAQASFTYLEGRDHFNLYQGGLGEKIAKEMYEVARPKAAAAAAQ